MTNVVTSTGILLLTPDTLIAIVKKVETRLAGWWWSLSQDYNRITLSVGPSKNCPNPLDVAFSQTSVGDSGFVYSFYFCNPHQETNVLSWVDLICDTADIHRKAMNPDFVADPNRPMYRHQSERDLLELSRVYKQFIDGLSLIENKGHLLGEIYLGSCDFSADCSLRGKRSDNSEFDITMDLPGKEDTIAEAFSYAASELINDILTDHNKTVVNEAQP